jgi:mannose-1-phosphate guanylyltransferase
MALEIVALHAQIIASFSRPRDAHRVQDRRIERRDVKVSALVLAAGRGERLRPFTDTVPKPLLPVLDRPILSLILDQLLDAGIKRIGINASYLADQIVAGAEAFGPSDDRRSIEVRTEARPSGPAGALRVFSDVVQSSDVTVVVSGDAVIALDVAGLVERHLETSARFTVVTKKITNAGRYGVVEADGTGRVVAWREKPPVAVDEEHEVSCGVYAVAPDVVRQLSASDVVDFGLHLALPLLKDDRRVTSVPCAGYWTDIGSPQALHEANLAAVCGETGIVELNRVVAASRAMLRSLPDSVTLEGQAFIGRAAIVGPGATLVGPVVVGGGARVGAGARVERSVLLPGSEVPAGTEVVDRLVQPDPKRNPQSAE